MEPKKVEVDSDGVHLSGSAKCEVFVCFKGPLEEHLMPLVKEKKCKGESVEIFSLLSLEKFNLEKVKPD